MVDTEIHYPDDCFVGFFYVKNHGVPQELIDREFEVNTRYFKLPSEVTSALPQVKWASHELLGHEVGNRVAGKPGISRDAFSSATGLALYTGPVAILK